MILLACGAIGMAKPSQAMDPTIALRLLEDIRPTHIVPRVSCAPVLQHTTPMLDPLSGVEKKFLKLMQQSPPDQGVLTLQKQFPPISFLDHQGQTYFFSNIFKMADEPIDQDGLPSRLYAILYSPDEHGKIMPRLLYRSYSDGGWRAAFFVGRPMESKYLSKGLEISLPYVQGTKLVSSFIEHLEENTIQHPPRLQQVGSWRTVFSLPKSIDWTQLVQPPHGFFNAALIPPPFTLAQEAHVITEGPEAETLKLLQVCPAGKCFSCDPSTGNRKGVGSTASQCLGWQPDPWCQKLQQTIASLHPKPIPPIQTLRDYILQVVNPKLDPLVGQFVPRFTTAPLRTYTLSHTILSEKTANGDLSKDITVEVFSGSYLGRATDWHMATSLDGKTWIERVEFRDGKTTSYGTSKEIIDIGILGNKPFDYHQQTCTIDCQKMNHSIYCDLTQFLENLSPIKQYLNAKHQRVFDAQQININQLFQIAENGTTPDQEKQLKERLTHQDLDINFQREDGHLPLSLAIEKGHLKIVQALIQNPRCNPNRRLPFQKTPLFLAMQQKNKDILLALLEYPKLDLQTDLTEKPHTSFLELVLQADDDQLIKILFRSQQFSSHMILPNGQSFIQNAISTGKLKIIEALLMMNQSVQAKDVKFIDPNLLLSIAIEHKQLSMIQILLKQLHESPFWKDIKLNPDILFDIAIKNKDPLIMKFLLEEFFNQAQYNWTSPPNSQDLLVVAIAEKNLLLVQGLLELSHVDPNQTIVVEVQNADGNQQQKLTSFQFAMMSYDDTRESQSILKYLLAHSSLTWGKIDGRSYEDFAKALFPGQQGINLAKIITIARQNKSAAKDQH